MQHYFCFKDADQMLQDIRSNNCLFEGLPIIIGVDFAQILLIICQGPKVIIVKACI